jgi:uncharacterized protein
VNSIAPKRGDVTPVAPEDGVFARFPDVRIDPDNVAHYRGLLERRYLLHRCAACGTWNTLFFGRCPRCASDDVRPTAVSGRGRIELVTRFFQGPAVDGVSYGAGFALGIVELDEQPGLRVSAPLETGARMEDALLGARVEIGWQELGGMPTAVFRVVAVDAGVPA